MLGAQSYPGYPAPNGRVETMGGAQLPWGPRVRGIAFGTAALFATVGASAATLANSAYYDGVSWRHQDANAPSIYYQAGGVHQWYADAAGSAGATYTPTLAMQLGSFGLGVGRTPIASDMNVAVQSTTSVARYRLGNTTNANAADFFVLAGDAGLYNLLAGNLFLGTNNTTRVIIDASGNVGIGVVPGNEKLQVSGNLSVDGFTSGYEIRLRSGFANTASGGAGIGSVDVSGDSNKDGLGLYGHDGVQVFTAQTARVTIDASGNVGIGTTPAANFKLDIAGAGWDTVRLGQRGDSSHISVAFELDSSDGAWGFQNDTGVLKLFSGTVPGTTIGTQRVAIDASGNLTIGSGSISDSKGDVRGIPQNSQSVAYTLVLSDAGKHILHPSADTTARTFTIPANASVAYPIGTAITFVNQSGAGTLTIAITTDTMRLAGSGATGSRTLAANGIATALKVTATEWIISGTGLT